MRFQINDFVFSEGKEFVTAVVSMLIDSVKNQSEHKMDQPTKMDQPAKSDHTSKMDQLYSLWCREPTPITESEPKTIIAVTVENVIITTGQPDVKEVQPKSRLEGDSFEEVQKIIIVCAPIVSISVLLILLVLIFQTCKGAGSSAPIPKIQILPVATGRETGELMMALLAVWLGLGLEGSGEELCWNDGWGGMW